MKTTEILESLNWRYAVKKFDSTKKIDSKTWSDLEEVLRLTPSSYGLQPWKFVLVQNPEIRERLKSVSRNQSQVTDCSHYVVLTYLENINETYVDTYLQRVAQVRGIELSSLDSYRKALVEGLLHGRRAHQLDRWAERQTYIAMGQLMTAAALLKIDTCPMEGLEPEAYDEILNLKGTGYKTIASVACGFRSTEDKYSLLKKVRFEGTDIFDHRY